MSSLKMTFSLASLILMFVFLAMPVMAHDSGVTAHDADANTTDHVLLESVAINGTYLTDTGRLTATATFAAADTIPDPRPDTGHYVTAPSGLSEGSFEVQVFDPAAGTWGTAAGITIRRFNTVTADRVYTVEIEAGADAIDGKYRVGLASGVAEVPTDYQKEFTVDNADPTITGIEILPVSGQRYQDEWDTSFRVRVTVSDGDSDTAGVSGIDLSSLSLKAAPGILTFSSGPTERPEAYVFVFSASIKSLAADADAETMATAVTITASVSDMAGNMSAAEMDAATNNEPTKMVNIAARTHPDRAPGKPGKPMAAPLTGADDGKVMISWTAPSDLGNPALTGYYITKHYTDASGAAATKRFPPAGLLAESDTSYTIPPAGATETRVPAGTYTFTVTAVSTGYETASDASDSITIDPPTDNPPVFAAETGAYTVVQNTRVSLILDAATDAEDEAAALTYSIDSNTPLPIGLGFNAAGRVIAGQPRFPGLSTVRYVVTDTAGQTDSMLITFTVNPAPAPPVIIPDPTDPPTDPDPPTFGSASVSVPALTAGTAMTAVSLPEATGNTGALSYSLWVGQKDITASGYNGLSYDAAKRALMGTPIAADATGTIFTWRATDGATNLSDDLSFNVVVNPKAIVPTPTVKARATFSGTLDLTPNSVSVIEVTFDKAVTGLTADDFAVAGGFVADVQVKPNLPAAMENKVWQVQITADGSVFTESITVTIASTSTLAEPAATMGSLTTQVADGTLSSITPSTGADDTAPFTVTLTFAAALPTGADVIASDLKLTPMTAKVTGIASLDRITWQVQITPTAGMDTKIELSDTGKLKFAYTGAALTVMKKGTTPTPGAITATLNAAKTEVTLSGSIASNGFAIVESASLPNLEEFFTIGGTIGVDNGDTTDDKNARSVVISEILWGLDFGERDITKQNKHQFIELYNTTNAAIDLAGWKLIFTEGRPVPASDIDQVSNREGAGWDVNIGQSGRVTNTTADGGGTSAPINIVSMYRKINYAKVEKVKADGTADPNRDEQLKGIPGANAPGSWAASTRASANGIVSTPGRQHFATTAILTASSVAGTPFRINEIGNDTGPDNDWVELHNVTDSEASLKNYQLTAVTAKGTDTELHDFKDQDWKVPAKGFVVISTRHPRDTDLAAGKDISIADDQEDNAGASHLFVVKPVNLPDNGKFALVLRNAHDKEKSDGHLIDFVATRQGAFADNTIGSSIWPLKATGLPHENVIDGGDENFAAGKVYQRNGGNGRGDKQFAVRGYTGIGYDRAAAATGVNGGTPGYDNGALKEKIADLSNAAITISEIMVDVGEGRQNLAQWIELHNSSMTQAVNLAGWKLAIENTNDVDTALNATLALDGMTISPNQTVLIVSTSGRVSDADHFPSNRVVNLWTTKKHRDELEMTRRTDQVISATGFHLKLTDKDNKLVDEAGNLDGDRRTRDDLTKTWAIPTGENDGRRSSMIRIYDDGVAINGTMEEAWVSADATNLAFAISQTYYGNPDDFGTPGFKAGGPLPVSLSKFRPERLKDTGEIVVRWVTESELNNAGFNILRSEKRDGEFTKVHFEAGQGTTSERNVYEWKDKTAKPNVVYYYQIQDVSLDGDVTPLRITHLRGNVTAAGKATTTWGEIKALR